MKQLKTRYISSLLFRLCNIYYKEKNKSMKNKTELKEEMKKVFKQNFLEENFVNDAIPGSEKKLAEFAKKFENTLDEFSEKLSDLADEGEELVKGNLFKDQSVGQRNNILLTAIGILRKIKQNIQNSTVDIRRKL
jgi:hypothetical protein